MMIMMVASSCRFLAVALLLLAGPVSSFMVVGPSQQQQLQRRHRNLPTTPRSSTVVIAASPTDESPAGETEEAPSAVENTKDANADEGDDEGEDVVVEKEEPEDPEVTALKAEIGALEAELKIIRGTLSHTEEVADEYSKTGYARKVAEMENVRRARKSVQSSNKSTATAGLLSQFLPTLDRLIALRDKYSEDEFGKQYGALPTALQTALIQLDVTEYFVEIGADVDAERMTVTESVPSDTAPARTVTEAIMPGLELQGNVVRPAMVVASSGPEGGEEAAADSDDSSTSEEGGEETS